MGLRALRAYLQVEPEAAGARGEHEEEVLGARSVEEPQQLAPVVGLGGAVQPEEPGDRRTALQAPVCCPAPLSSRCAALLVPGV